jgi:hypothetical protein
VAEYRAKADEPGIHRLAKACRDPETEVIENISKTWGYKD